MGGRVLDPTMSLWRGTSIEVPPRERDARSAGPGLGRQGSTPLPALVVTPRGVAGLYAPAPSVNPLQPHSE